jgi:hypothetical protein
VDCCFRGRQDDLGRVSVSPSRHNVARGKLVACAEAAKDAAPRNLRQIRIYHHYPIFPHWVLMLACALIGAVPWLRWRFRIRGVLVLMAFLAAMFAILVFE